MKCKLTDADTTVARTRNVDQRENVTHTGAPGDIPNDEGSRDEFKLVVEGNRNVSYDTKSNKIIMSHPSVNEKSKLTVTLKNERVIELGKIV